MEGESRSRKTRWKPVIAVSEDDSVRRTKSNRISSGFQFRLRCGPTELC